MRDLDYRALIEQLKADRQSHVERIVLLDAAIAAIERVTISLDLTSYGDIVSSPSPDTTSG